MHLRANGYPVDARNVDDLGAIKTRHGIGRRLESCHTALVDGYVVEGHVPADVIDRLLRERPAVVGIAVPGMPSGSPGMEDPSRRPEPYQVLTFDKHGRTALFTSR